jgi:hypothetical protein
MKLNADDFRDVAIRIVDNMVEQGIVKSCIDTDDDTEFTIQDIIVTELLDAHKEQILDLYKKHIFTDVDNAIINDAIEYGVLETDEILSDFIEYADRNIFTEYLSDFNEHYQNGLTHLENFDLYLDFKNSLIV